MYVYKKRIFTKLFLSQTSLELVNRWINAFNFVENDTKFTIRIVVVF